MNETKYSENHVRSLAAIIAELKDEIKDFVQTRVEMFRSELRETLDAWKTAVPLAAIAVLLRGNVERDCGKVPCPATSAVPVFAATLAHRPQARTGRRLPVDRMTADRS